MPHYRWGNRGRESEQRAKVTSEGNTELGLGTGLSAPCPHSVHSRPCSARNTRRLSIPSQAILWEFFLHPPDWQWL